MSCGVEWASIFIARATTIIRPYNCRTHLFSKSGRPKIGGVGKKPHPRGGHGELRRKEPISARFIKPSYPGKIAQIKKPAPLLEPVIQNKGG